MAKTRIEWADAVWNPITGCTPISEGCQNCYAKRMAKRLAGRCGYPKDDPFLVTLHPERLNEPLKWKTPRRVFVCSMGDLFHEDVPNEFIDYVFAVMGRSQQHTFILLTKRPERMREYLQAGRYQQILNIAYRLKFRPEGLGKGIDNPKDMRWWPNVWLGVTAENQQRADERIPILLQIPAAVRFVSVEPMHPDWVRSLRDQCQAAGVPFFFKQWGEYGLNWLNDDNGKIEGSEWMDRMGKKKAGRILDGRTWDEMPCTQSN